MTDEIRAEPAPRCIVCGSAGEALYAGARDRLFGASGEWNHRKCASPGCGLVWMDPMPMAEDLHKAYASYYTHTTPTERGLLGRAFDAAGRGYVANHYGYGVGVGAFERFLGLLPWLYPGRTADLDFSTMWMSAPATLRRTARAEEGARPRLLDVGAGSGWLVRQMSRRGWSAEGLDFDPVAVAQARAGGLTMHLGSLEAQRFPAATFDAVTMSHSLEHVPDPLAVLREARRILRSGGRLAIATPNTRSLLHRHFGHSWFPLDPPRHLHLFNRGALAMALRSAGFERFSILTSVRDANGAFLGSRSIRATGRYDMMGPQPAPRRAAARMVQLFEAAARLIDRDAGEDLVGLATA